MRLYFVLLICTFSFSFLSAQNCDTLRITEVACQGDSLMIGDSIIFSTGNYEIRINQGDCDSIILLAAVFRSLPEFEISGDTTVCDYGTTLSTSESFSTYVWSTGETAPTIFVDQFAEYCVTVTDNFGCSNADCVQVIEGRINLEIFGDTLYCDGFNTSLIANPVDGVAPFSYSWTGPDNFSWNLDVVNATIPGTYCLEVFDSRSCFETTCITIYQLPSASLIDTNIIAGTAVGGGQIDITLDSINPPYQYLWSNNSFQQDLVNVPNGPYSVTIIDANSCPSIFQFNIPLRTSTQQLNTYHCNLYPTMNRKNGIVYLDCINEQISSVQLFTLNGKSIKTLKFDQAQIQLPSTITSGVFILNLKFENGSVQNSKIIIP